MTITSADIHNQSFSIDRKGYDVDEVDVFLEHVAFEIDALNVRIAELEEASLNASNDDSKFDGFDIPVSIDDDMDAAFEPQTKPEAAPAFDASEFEARIAELEQQLEQKQAELEEKRANDSAISQALIIAQRSADDVVAEAKSRATKIINEAESESERIARKAEADRQKVIDQIRQLEDDREDTREAYQALLRDFIDDATQKMIEIGGEVEIAIANSSHARLEPATALAEAPLFESAIGPAVSAEASEFITPAAAPVNAAPVFGVAAAEPQAAEFPAPAPFVGKDLSGFGDADDSFEFDELD